jgi:hypothetical protein
VVAVSYLHISGWMEKNGYPVVNSEKAIFMKRFHHSLLIC